ncbi:HAD family hydrolase [Nitratidesulfovibrio sp.]|uniref:HAD family hydrolase n=1 Tax=Nitratidesulfovibrio sp. TaxID=2802297 RepID=UPI00333F6237
MPTTNHNDISAAPDAPTATSVPDKALLLDWGGTLMRVMPRWMGPQHGWTDEEPMPHAGEVLCALAAGWRLALASNASESDEGPIRAALAPMGVGPLLAGVYTWRSAGAPKPWPPFWAYALRDLGLPANRAVMIGDDWTGDVWGATQAGMSGIWFDPPRPGGQTREARTTPRVRTMRDFRELPGLLAELGFEG